MAALSDESSVISDQGDDSTWGQCGGTTCTATARGHITSDAVNNTFSAKITIKPSPKKRVYCTVLHKLHELLCCSRKTHFLWSICITLLWCFCNSVEGTCPVPTVTSLGGFTVPHISSCQLEPANLSHSGIQLLHFPQPLENLHLLDLSYNEIEYIRSNTFAEMRILEDLDISNNKLIAINRDTFHGSDIIDLNLGNNQIALLVNGAFGGLENKLEELCMASNRLEKFPSEVFKGLLRLKYIDLSSNQLTTIGQGDFIGLPSLRKLLVRENKLVFINGWLASLRYFDLTNNSITNIQLVPQNSTTQIYIEGNLLSCSCENKDFGAWCLSTGYCFMDNNCTNWFYEAIMLAHHCNQTRELLFEQQHEQTTTESTTEGDIEYISSHGIPNGARTGEQYFGLFVTLLASPVVYTLN